MAVQSPPAVLQNASHSAALFREAWSAPFSTGGILATGELAVSQQPSPNMSVVLGAGRAMITGTSVSAPSGLNFTTQGRYFVLNDADVTLTIATSDPTNPRIDAIYEQVQDSFYSGAANIAVAAVATGTPSVSPVPPAIPANSILIAYVAVATNATTIVNANISYQAAVAALAGGRPGLVSVVPTSVTGGTVGAGGVITVSAATSVSINGCFTTAYDNYLVVVDVTHSTAAGLNVKLRGAGSDTTGAFYSYQLMHVTGTSVSASNTSVSLATGFPIQAIGGVQTSGELTLFSPALPVFTRMQTSNTVAASSSTAFGLASYGGNYASATAYDGLTFVPSAGNITGTIRIYAYNNN